MDLLRKSATVLLLMVSLAFCESAGNAVNYYNADTGNRAIFTGFCEPDFGFNDKSAMTIAAWVKWDLATPGSPLDAYSNICSNNSQSASDAGQFWLQHNIDNTKFEFAIKTVSSRAFVQASNTTIVKGVWYHVAGVYDDVATVSLKIYVNGVLDNSNNTPTGLITPWLADYMMKAGRWSLATSARSFDGIIDELQIWDRGLSAAEIQQIMCHKLTGGETNLVGYWNWDEATGYTVVDKSGDNHPGWIMNEVGRAESGAATTLTDNDKTWVENALAGKLIAITNGTGVRQLRTIASNTDKIITVTEAWVTIPNTTSMYALTSVSERVPSYAPLGDASISDYTGTVPGDFSVNLSHGDGDDVTITGTGGTITGLQSYRVDAPPDNITPPTGWNSVYPLRYWGVFVVGSGSPTYTFQYNYEGNPGAVNEANIGMGYRSGVTRPWSDLVAVLDTDANTLTKTGQTGTEYILLEENPIAVSLSALEAVFVDASTVDVRWSAELEAGVAGYNVYRSLPESGEYAKLSERLIMVVDDDAAPHRYHFQDGTVEQGTPYFYKVESVQLDGSVEWHGPVSPSRSASVEKQELPDCFALHPAFPNPFNPTTTIAFDLPVAGAVTLTAYDVNGRQVDVLLQETLPAGRHQQAWDAANFPSGVYFIQMQTEGFTAMQRVLLLK